MRPITPLDIVEHHLLRDVQLSPDGQYAAFTRVAASKTDTPSLPSSIWLANLKTNLVQPLITFPGTSALPRWSPGASRLAFIADHGQAGQTALYTVEVQGMPVQHTVVAGEIESLAWTPDGAALLFTYTEPELFIEGQADARVEDAYPRYRRVWQLTLNTGEVRPATPDGLQIHEVMPSPDGKRLGLIAKQGEASPTGWYTAQIYVFDREREQLTQVCTTPKQICALVWSPDSTQLAFLTSYISDQPLWSGDVCIVPATGGEPRQLSDTHLPFSFTVLFWHEAERLLYCARHNDGTSFGWLDVQTGQVQSLWQSYAMIGDWAVPRLHTVTAGKTFAAVLERPDTPPQVYTGTLDSADAPWQQVSTFAYPTLDVGRLEPITWRSFDGLEIGGHVVYPANYEPGRRYPTFVQIHGGPTWSWLPHYAVWWEWWYLYLASRGYLCFLPNVRGSTGSGTAFAELNIGDIGGGDWKDVLSGVDHLVERGLADEARLGIGGWSYGGYMAAWAVSQTNRFKAAVMGAGLFSWESYWGQNSIRDWHRFFFGSTPYENPMLHRERSPLNTIAQARTPTLILQGREDRDVGMPQAYEMYAALKTLGVDTQLVTYPREHHPILERDHQIDLLTRIDDWLRTYLLGG